MKRGMTSHILQAIFESNEQLFKCKIPIESQLHFRQANKELLIGIRAWVNHHLLELEQGAEEEISMTQSNHDEMKKIKISD